jgi:hypothetical protein
VESKGAADEAGLNKIHKHPGQKDVKYGRDVRFLTQRNINTRDFLYLEEKKNVWISARSDS